MAHYSNVHASYSIIGDRAIASTPPPLTARPKVTRLQLWIPRLLRIGPTTFALATTTATNRY